MEGFWFNDADSIGGDGASEEENPVKESKGAHDRREVGSDELSDTWSCAKDGITGRRTAPRIGKDSGFFHGNGGSQVSRRGPKWRQPALRRTSICHHPG
jgi:hypothetical protein